MAHFYLEIGVTTNRGHSYDATIQVSSERLYRLHNKMIGGKIGDLFPTASTAVYEADDFWTSDKAFLVVEAALTQALHEKHVFRFTPWPKGGREMFHMGYVFSAYVREFEGDEP